MTAQFIVSINENIKFVLITINSSNQVSVSKKEKELILWENFSSNFIRPDGHLFSVHMDH